MTIDEIYRLVQTFANKEQRGFITPSDFNLLAKQAELELFNKRLEAIKGKDSLKKAAGYGNDELTPSLAEQDLSRFLNKRAYSLNYDSISVSGLKERYQDIPNALHVCEVFTFPDENESLSSYVPVDIVSPETINKVLRSSLVKPSAEYPVALLSSGQGSMRVQVFPEELTRIVVYYYKNPESFPAWNYITIAGKPVYDPTSSVQSNFGPRVHGELVLKILEYLGINLREVELANYAMGKDTQAQVKE